VLPEEIQCRGDRILVIRDGGSPACVYAGTAERTGWQTILPKVDIMQDPTVTVRQNADHGTTVVSVKSSETASAMINLCALWPKNIQASFPNTVKVNEEFDVSFEYTYIVYEPGDIAESSRTGMPLARNNAEELLDNPRAECIDTRVYLVMSDSLDLITDGVFEESRTSTRTDRVTDFYHIDYAFNNTAKQTQNITLRFNSLPDRYDDSLLLGTAGNPVNVVHFTDNNGTIYLTSPPSDRNVVDVRGVSASSVSALEKIKSDFYAKDIALPERDFIIRHNSTNFIPLEDLADIVELHNITGVGDWLRDTLQYPQDYIDEFFEKFPDLAARFLIFLGLDIPNAYAQAPQLVSVYGWVD